MSPGSGFRPWSVRHVDLSGDVPALEQNPGLGGVYVVVWWRDIPLGDLRFASGQLPMSSVELRNAALDAIAPAVGSHVVPRGFSAPTNALAPGNEAPGLDELLALQRPLERLEQVLGERWSAVDSGASVSVIVCTRDRPAALERCLAAIGEQSLEPHEVIVVDNDPATGATRALVEGKADVRYVAEPTPGLSAARNSGIRESAGELVAFTDDDVVVHREWLRRLIPAFDAPDVMCVTGLVLPAELETEPQWHFENVFGGFGQGFRPRRYGSAFFEAGLARGVPAWLVGAGANMAFRRELFERVGCFDERLGSGTSGCGDDSELWYRALAAGYVCRYEPTSVVHHYHRRDAEALRRQMHQYMRGHVAALFVQHERHGDLGNLRRALVTLPRIYSKSIAGRLLFGAAPAHRTLWAEARGCVSGAWYYLRTPTPPGPRTVRARHKARLGPFLARNPFDHPLTLGFFYREKMRAIHRVAPDAPYEHVLEVGGGRGGLTSLLYPRAQITNLDIDAGYADSPVNRRPGVRFVQGDATALPFPDASFDAVTMFDVLEHIPDDRAAVAEALRVLRPGGALLVSSPNGAWRFPYHAPLRRICPSEHEMCEEWGHVRRGYSLDALRSLIGLPCERRATFINRLTVLAHDVSFSRLPLPLKRVLLAAMMPVSWLGYAMHHPGARGTETASLWRKPRETAAA